MKKITIKKKAVVKPVEKGDLILIDEEVYIFVAISPDDIRLINLANGNRWDNNNFINIMTQEQILRVIKSTHDKVKFLDVDEISIILQVPTEHTPTKYPESFQV